MFPCRGLARCLVAVAALLVAGGSAVAQENKASSDKATKSEATRNTAAEALLSADSSIVFCFDGLAAHQAAFEQTAWGQLLRADLGPLAEDLRRRLLAALGPDVVASRLLAGGRPEELISLQADAKHFPRLLDALVERGVLVGVEVFEGVIPGVHITMVFPGEGTDEDPPAIQAAVRLVARVAEMQLSEQTNAGRTILQGTFLQFGNLSCWQEGNYVVVTLGTIGPDGTIALADGKRKSLAGDSHWTQLRGFQEYETYARGYVDTARLQRILTMWVSAARPILSQLGVDGLSRVSLHLGFEGPYQRSTMVLTTNGERRGVLQLLTDVPSLDVARLPPLPPDASTVATVRIEPQKAYRYFRETVEKLIPADEWETFQKEVTEFESALGGEAMKKALAALGSTVVGYIEPGAGLPFFGGTLAIEVKDQGAFESALKEIIRALESAGRNTFKLLRREYRGVPLYVFQSKEQFFPVHPSFAVSNGWLYVGLTSQSVQAGIYRFDSKTGRLSFSSELQRRIEQLTRTRPEGEGGRKLLAFSQFDPRPSVQVILGVLPMFARLVGVARGEGRFFADFDATLLPHTQAVTERLSPNFALVTDNGTEIRFDSYSTLPLPFDFASFGTLFSFAAFSMF